MPKFVWDYLDSGTGAERTKTRNRAALDQLGFIPKVLSGPQEVDLSCRLFGESCALPFGVAPVGMSGLIWPNAEQHLARSAGAAAIPYCLSTVASQSPEDLAPALGSAPEQSGDERRAWFQLYPPKTESIRKDMLDRARKAGFGVLVLTVDVPVASRRERQQRSGLTQPPRLTPRLLAQVATCPQWAMAMLRKHWRSGGMPYMRTLTPYIEGNSGPLSSTAHVGYLLRAAPDWSYLEWLRAHWQGPLVVKGVLHAAQVQRMEAMGVDAIWVSNHAGRQLDGSPAPIEVLADIRGATELPLIFDGGVETGLDIMRAFALGADFTMLGRGFHYALAALGPEGADHLVDLLKKDLDANMGQLGLSNLSQLRDTSKCSLMKLPPL